MIDQTPTPILPRYRGGRLTRHDRRVINAEAQAKFDAWLSSPEMVTRRASLHAEAAALAAPMTRPTRAPMRSSVA